MLGAFYVEITESLNSVNNQFSSPFTTGSEKKQEICANCNAERSLFIPALRSRLLNIIIQNKRGTRAGLIFGKWDYKDFFFVSEERWDNKQCVSKQRLPYYDFIHLFIVQKFGLTLNLRITKFYCIKNEQEGCSLTASCHLQKLMIKYFNIYMEQSYRKTFMALLHWQVK